MGLFMFFVAAIPLLVAVGGAWGYIRYTNKKDSQTDERDDGDT